MKLTVILLCLTLFWGVCEAASWSLIYPRPLNGDDRRQDYPLALLKLALSKTGVRYTLLPSNRIMLQGKAIRQLKENREVNVIWAMTDAQREKDLLPIRIPITKGLIGWRVFFIDKHRQRLFNQVSHLKDLTRYTPVQGEEWPDTKILQANGFNVLVVSDYPEAFSSLAAGQADLFPRSVIEVMGEMGSNTKGPDIQLESNLLIHYPAAMYFFVNRSNPIMARLIETGLKRALEDGSFDELFLAEYQDDLEQINVEGRLRFELTNPQLPPKTPTGQSSLWYHPDRMPLAEKP